VLWVTDKAVGLRVSPDEEAAGLDASEHAEVAYEWPGDVIRVAGAIPGGAQPTTGTASASGRDS
jgi:hypothetical protein